MKYVSTASVSRKIDADFINEKSILGVILMEDAAWAVTSEVMKHEGDVLVVCGTGNNGGDGFAVLRQLVMHGRSAKALIVGDSKKISGDAKINYDACKALSLDMIEASDEAIVYHAFQHHSAAVIVDALFGTGLCRELEGLYALAVDSINDSTAYKIAVDIPSGISADTGNILKKAVKADITVTFQTAKRGHMLYPGREYTGKLIVAPIGVGHIYRDEVFLEESDVCEMLPKRMADSHKGTYGKLLIIAGSDEYAGAAVMSAMSAQRSGVGLIKLIAQKRACDELLHAAPEIMTCIAEDWKNIDISRHIKWCETIAIGMGLGSHDGLKEIMQKVLMSGKKVIIDADGINIISHNRELLSLLNENCILTPHAGEFSRLTGKSIDEILENAVEVTKKFAVSNGTNILFKGATSIIAREDGKVCYNLTGNTSLAKGGSGDTLSGLIASMAAQGSSVYDAACIGAYIQGAAAESFAVPISVTASDISKKTEEFLKSEHYI